MSASCRRIGDVKTQLDANGKISILGFAYILWQTLHHYFKIASAIARRHNRVGRGPRRGAGTHAEPARKRTTRTLILGRFWRVLPRMLPVLIGAVRGGIVVRLL